MPHIHFYYGPGGDRGCARLALAVGQENGDTIPAVAGPDARTDFVAAPPQQFFGALRVLPVLVIVSDPDTVAADLVHTGDVDQIPLLVVMGFQEVSHGEGEIRVEKIHGRRPCLTRVQLD